MKTSNSKKKFLLFLFSLLIGVGFFVWIIDFVGWQEIKNAFLVFTGWQGMVILGLTILIAVIGAWRWKQILAGEGVNISFGGVFKLYLSGFAAMFLAPIISCGGVVFLSYFLKEKHSVSWSKGVASVIIDRVLEWTANLAVIFFGTLFFLLAIGLPPMKLIMIFSGVFLIFAAGIGFFYFKSFRSESMVRFFIRNGNNRPLGAEKEIFNFFNFRNMSMWKSFGLSFLRVVVMYLRVWFLIIFLGREIAALPILSILGFSYLSAMVFIPASLGSHELIQAFSFEAFGLGAGTGVIFAMIIRAAEIILTLFGIIILFKLGLGLLQKALFRKIENLINNKYNNNQLKKYESRNNQSSL